MRSMSFRKTLIASIVILMIAVGYTLPFVFHPVSGGGSLFIQLLRQYTFIFVYFGVQFLLMLNPMNNQLSLSRYSTMKNYLKSLFLYRTKNLTMFFIVITLVEIIYFPLIDVATTIGMLLYRNIIFYCVLTIVAYLSITANHHQENKHLILWFMFLFFQYLMMILFDEAIITNWNVFGLLQGFNIIRLLQWACVLGAVCLIKQYRLNHTERCVNKWLE